MQSKIIECTIVCWICYLYMFMCVEIHMFLLFYFLRRNVIGEVYHRVNDKTQVKMEIECIN